MVLAMKVISLGFDVDQGHSPVLPSLWQYSGYVFHPGSIIFGPWISYKEYNLLYNIKKKKIVSTQLNVSLVDLRLFLFVRKDLYMCACISFLFLSIEHL